jgi:hypothetical protein
VRVRDRRRIFDLTGGWRLSLLGSGRELVRAVVLLKVKSLRHAEAKTRWYMWLT